MARIALATLVGALAASIGGCGGGEGPPAAALVVYERSGGIAGFDDRLVVKGSREARLEPLARAGAPKSFRLSRDEITHLESLLHRAAFDTLRSDYSSEDVVDESHYRILYGGRAVDADDTVLPGRLRPLVNFLGEVTDAYRARPSESANGGNQPADAKPVLCPNAHRPRRVYPSDHPAIAVPYREHTRIRAIDRYGRRHPGSFAGDYLGRPHGGMVLRALFAGDLPHNVSRLPGFVSRPDNLEIFRARYTMRELRRAQRAVTRALLRDQPALKLGTWVSSVGVDVSRNVVEIGLRHYARAAATRIGRRYGPITCVSPHDEGIVLATE